MFGLLDHLDLLGLLGPQDLKGLLVPHRLLDCLGILGLWHILSPRGLLGHLDLF